MAGSISLNVTPIPPKLKGTWSSGKGSQGASEENCMYACSPTASIPTSTNPRPGFTNSTSILKLSGVLTSPSTLLRVISKNFAPDSISSIIWNFAVDSAANSSAAPESTSSTDNSGVGVGSDSHAAARKRNPNASTVIDNLRPTAARIDGANAIIM